MSLPSDTDYVVAIQNPANCFADSDLRTGSVELMGPALPFPKARSGNFATVYKLSCKSSSWAVRCFTRPVHQDQRLRYDEISKALASARIPHAVGFSYLEQGIRVGGVWHPIVKMEWVQGEPLDVYIARHLHDQRALVALSKSWVEMSALLGRHGLAHGDLQHGNVLVVQGALRLVDYDGMFVPALAGYPSHESGHRNYQHPKRNGGTFGPTLDHFSEWVVFVSLLALASSPRLWSAYKGGDDCLLLRRADFEDPDGSAILTELCAMGDSRARAAASLFRALVQLPPEQVPPLDASLVAASVSVQVPAAGALPGWIAGQLPQTPKPKEQEAGGAMGAASWILDHLDAGRPVASWPEPVTRERGLLAATLVALLAAWLTAPETARLFLALLSGMAPLVHLAYWRTRYIQTEAFRQVADAAGALDRSDRGAKRAAWEVKQASTDLARISKRHATEAQVLARERSDIEASRQAALGSLQSHLQQTIAAVEARRKAIDQREAADRQAVIGRHGSAIITTQNGLTFLVQQEAMAVSAELSKLEHECVERALRGESILHVPVNRTGPLLILHSAGITNLFDAEPLRVLDVRGVGKKTNDAVQARRRQVASRAQINAPKTLPPNRDAQARAPFVGKRVAAEQELRRLEAMRDQELQRIKATCDRERAEATAVLAQAQRDFSIAEQRAQADSGTKLADCNARIAREEANRVKEEGQAERLLAEARKRNCSVEFVRQRMLRDVERLKGQSFKAYVRRVIGAA